MARAYPEDGDPYRAYFIPASSVSEKQQLLEHDALKKFSHALPCIYMDFYLWIDLMRGYAKNNDDEEYTCFLLAEKLCQPLDRLSQACSGIGDWQLIRQKTAGVAA